MKKELVSTKALDRCRKAKATIAEMAKHFEPLAKAAAETNAQTAETTVRWLSADEAEAENCEFFPEISIRVVKP
jgi:hypothetical protein